MVKFLNFMRERGQPQDAVEHAAADLLRRAGRIARPSRPGPEELLRIYRDLGRQDLRPKKTEH